MGPWKSAQPLPHTEELSALFDERVLWVHGSLLNPTHTHTRAEQCMLGPSLLQHPLRDTRPMFQLCGHTCRRTRGGDRNTDTQRYSFLLTDTLIYIYVYKHIYIYNTHVKTPCNYTTLKRIHTCTANTTKTHTTRTHTHRHRAHMSSAQILTEPKNQQATSTPVPCLGAFSSKLAGTNSRPPFPQRAATDSQRHHLVAVRPPSVNYGFQEATYKVLAPAQPWQMPSQPGPRRPPEPW